MNTHIEKTSALGRKITVIIPTDEIEEHLNKQLKEMAKTIKIDGFRPGKIPTAILKQRFQKSARQGVVSSLIQDSLKEVLTKENLNVVGLPKIESVQDEEGMPFKCIATFEIFPDVILPDFTQINFEKLTVDITEQDFSVMLERVLKQYAQWLTVQRPAQNADRVLIDFVGKVDNKPFPGGTAQDVHLVLGDKQFIPGFEEGLINVKAEEEKVLQLKFPDSYPAKDLAGKDCEFTVTVKKVETAQLPELNEEFAKRMGIKSGDVGEFRQAVKQQTELGLRQILRGRMKSQLFDKLIELTPIELPQAMVNIELDNLHKEVHAHEKNQTDKEEHSAHDHPELVELAKKRVHTAILMPALIKRFDIKANAEHLHAAVADLAKIYEEPADLINWYMSDTTRLLPIQAMVLEEQVLDKLLETMRTVERTLSYEEVMRP